MKIYSYMQKFTAVLFLVAEHKSTHWWMDKSNLVYLYTGILFGSNKEGNTDTRYNEFETWKHAQWKKLVTRLYDSIYMQCPEKASPWTRKTD